MKALFWFNVKRRITGLILSIALFPLLMIVLKSAFGIAVEDMPKWGALAYLLCFCYFGSYSKDSGFKFTDQWLLLMPEPRSRLLSYSAIFSLVCITLALVHLAVCGLIYVGMYEPHDQLFARRPEDLNWSLLLHKLARGLKEASPMEHPVVVSAIGVFLLFGQSMIVFGKSKIVELRLVRQAPISYGSTRSLREKAQDYLRLAGLAIAGLILYRAPHLLPWVLLASLAKNYPQMLCSTFALSKRQSRFFSLPLLYLPALAFVGCFFGSLLAHHLSPAVERREIASVYAHSLVGQTVMPERRKLQLADPATTDAELMAIRSEYHDTYDSWFYSNEFPVSFAQATDKKSFPALQEAIEGYDSLERSDADANLYISKALWLRKHSDAQPNFHQWARYRPGESVTREMLGAADPFRRSFGIYIAFNAAPSQKIARLLVTLAKDPSISDADLQNVAASLSMQLQKETKLSWAIHASTEHLGTPADVDCLSYRGLSWAAALKRVDFPEFLNVCLRKFDANSHYSHIDSRFSRTWYKQPPLFASSMFTRWKASLHEKSSITN